MSLCRVACLSAFLIILAGGASAADTPCARAVTPSFDCPPGTQHALDPIGRDSSLALGVEEYCYRLEPDLSRMKHGHYVRWTASGTRREEGDYVNGQRDGVWRVTALKQVTETTWARGVKKAVRIVTPAYAWEYNFCECRPWEGKFFRGLGSEAITVQGERNDTCFVAASRAGEASGDVVRRYRVPRRAGWIAFPYATAGGPDMNALRDFQIPDSTAPAIRVPFKTKYR